MKYIIDLDGTIVHAEKANRDSVHFITELKKRHIPFLIMTNSIKSPKLIKDLLQSVGISVSTKEIINPITAINNYLNNVKCYSAFIVGSEIEREQIEIKHDSTTPEIIVLLDFEKANYSYCDLQYIYSLGQKGIPIVSASGSVFYLKNETKYLDTGAFVKLLEHAGDIHIKIMGKPSSDYFQTGISILDAEPHEVTVIGDDWSTDINGANKVGCEAILITSGKYLNGDEKKCNPTKLVDNLMEIFE